MGGNSMMYSIFVDPYTAAIRIIEPKDLTGNTYWNYVELDAETAGKLNAHLRDNRGAPMYKWIGGEVIERTEAERMEDWEPDPQPEATAEDYREMLRELGVDV